jgi:hypothetical protein
MILSHGDRPRVRHDTRPTRLNPSIADAEHNTEKSKKESK